MKHKLFICAVFFIAITGALHAQLLISEGFDGPEFPPPGWKAEGAVRVDATATAPYTPPYCAMFSNTNDGLISPLLADPGTMTFVHKKDNGNYRFYVQYAYDAENGPWYDFLLTDWEPDLTVNDYPIWAGQDWTVCSIDMTAYSNIYVRWIPQEPPPAAKTFYLDGVEIYQDPTVPVELSSFTGIITPQNYIMLEWITQSETAVSGYYIYKNRANSLSDAERINAFIQATNTSQEASYVFIDSEAMPGYTYYYWLQHIDLSGEYEFHGPVSVHLYNMTPDMPSIPLVTSLQNIYPNPFNPAATISFGLAKASSVEMVIMNVKGQVVRRLVSEYKNAGTYRVRWDGRSDNGTSVSTGVYLVRMSAGSYKSTQKLIMLK